MKDSNQELNETNVTIKTDESRTFDKNSDKTDTPKNPKKKLSGTDMLAVRCPVELHKKIKRAAKKADISIKEWILDACWRKLPKELKK